MTERRNKLPPRIVYLLAKCEGWNESGYQVCYHDGKKFTYDECPNDMFDRYVTDWMLIAEIV